MKANILKAKIRKIRLAAQAISELESEMVHCMAMNGADLPMPQQLEELADRLEPLLGKTNQGYATRSMCQNDHPGKEIFTDEWGFSYAL